MLFSPQVGRGAELHHLLYNMILLKRHVEGQGRALGEFLFSVVYNLLVYE